jgi:hypothetical protein
VEILRRLPSSRDGGVFGELTQGAIKQSFKRAVRRADIKGDPSTIAFWWGHEHVQTTQVDLDATLAMKKRPSRS